MNSSSQDNSSVTQDLEDHSLEIVAYVFNGVNILIACVVIVTNLLVVVSYARYKFVRTPPNLLLLNLSLSDLIVGPTIILINVLKLFFLHSAAARAPCVFAAWLMTISFLSQTVSLTWITIDRWVAVHYPHQRHTVLSYRRLLALVLIQWLVLFSAGSGCLWDTIWTPGLECYPFNVIRFRCMAIIGYPLAALPLVAMPIMCVMICTKLYRQRKRVHQGEDNQATPSSLRHRRTLRSLCIVLGLVYISWVPIAISATISELENTYSSEPRVKIIFRKVATAMLISNSAVNPLVYQFSCPTFKKALCLLSGMTVETQNQVLPAVGADLESSEEDLRNIGNGPSSCRLQAAFNGGLHHTDTVSTLIQPETGDQIQNETSLMAPKMVSIGAQTQLTITDSICS